MQDIRVAGVGVEAILTLGIQVTARPIRSQKLLFKMLTFCLGKTGVVEFGEVTGLQTGSEAC